MRNICACLLSLAFGAFILSSCNVIGSDSNESVWDVSGNTAEWTGSELSSRGMYDYAVEDNTEIAIQHTSNDSLKLTVTYNSEFRSETTFAGRMISTSNPQDFGNVSFEQRLDGCDQETDEHCPDRYTITMPFQAITLDGAVDCSQPSPDIDEFEAIFRDSEKVFVGVTFEATGMLDAIQGIVCD